MQSTTKLRKLTATALLAAIATGLMFVDFSIPIMPSFIKLDVSELPALLGAFSFGPVSGIAVCFIKNIFNLIFHGSTGGVGELCNFLLGVMFVVPASLIYKKMKSRKGALIGVIVGALAMAILSLPLNYYLTYPIYSKFMPLDTIISMYQDIATKIAPNSKIDGLFSCLLIFNVPFTFVKGLIDAVICFLIYKPLSPLLHGRKKVEAKKEEL